VLDGHHIGFEAAVDRGEDGVEDAVRVIADLSIPETQHPEALRFEPGLAFAVHRLGTVRRVGRAVDFDDDTGGKAGEIDNVPTKRDLSAEMSTGDGQSL
jgi:hypothetical protein